LGAYVLRHLIRSGADVAILEPKINFGILEQVLQPAEIDKVKVFTADITDGKAVLEAVLSFTPTAIVHLAGVQIPTVRGNPALGAAVNVAGTVNVFEAVRALAAQQKQAPIPVSYASSGAVLGPSSDYPAGAPLPAERNYHRPRTLYGVYKLCNEGTARIYFQDHSIPSAGLRPLTIFGVGREIGLTSGPTKAVKAAVLGRKFVIEVSGTTGFHYVADVARMFVEAAAGAARSPGAHVCGIKGHLVSYEAFLQEAEKVLPTVSQLASIKPGAPDVPIHGDVDEAPLRKLTQRDELHMPLDAAIADMVKLYKELHSSNKLHDKDLGPPPAAKL